MNKNDIRGRQGGQSWHNTAKAHHSALEVNDVVGWRRFPCLPGETCPALRPAKAGSASRGNTVGDRAGVSRGHSNRSVNRGDGIGPFKLGNPQARTGKDRTNIGDCHARSAHLERSHTADRAEGRITDLRTLSKLQPPTGAMSVGNRTQAETASSRGYTLIDVLEPENVAAAWKKVKANKGKPGIDGMEIEDFCPRSAHAMRSGIRSSANLLKTCPSGMAFRCESVGWVGPAENG